MFQEFLAATRFALIIIQIWYKQIFVTRNIWIATFLPHPVHPGYYNFCRSFSLLPNQTLWPPFLNTPLRISSILWGTVIHHISLRLESINCYSIMCIKTTELCVFVQINRLQCIIAMMTCGEVTQVTQVTWVTRGARRGRRHVAPPLLFLPTASSGQSPPPLSPIAFTKAGGTTLKCI